MAERVREDKQFKVLQQGHGKPNNTDKPSANAADGASNKSSKSDKPKPAANAADGTPKPPKGKGKGDDKKSQEPSKPPKGEGKGAKDAGNGSKDNKTPSKSTPCRFFTSDEGCKHGGKCTYFHPRVTQMKESASTAAASRTLCKNATDLSLLNAKLARMQNLKEQHRMAKAVTIQLNTRLLTNGSYSV
eukprot:5448475-Amphidinium_carterae.1